MKVIKLTDYSEVTPYNVIISSNHTTYANQKYLEFPSIKNIKDLHAKIQREAKEQGIKTVKRNKFLAKAKSLVEDAEKEHKAFTILFEDYYNFWKGKVINQELICTEDDLNEGSVISNNISKCFYGNTKLSSYLDTFRSLENALRTIEYEKITSMKSSDLTIYI